MAVMLSKFDFIISMRIQFDFFLTITSITLLMAYEFILKKMYGSEKLKECLNFNLHEMNSIKLKYHLQMRALIHDYNSF